MLFAPLVSLYKMKGKYQMKIVKLVFTQALNIVGMDDKEVIEKFAKYIIKNLTLTSWTTRWGLKSVYKTLKSFKNSLENVARLNAEIMGVYFEHGKNLHHFSSLENIQRFLRICVDASKLADECFEIIAHLLEEEDYKTHRDSLIVDIMEALDSRVPTDDLRKEFLAEKREYLKEHKDEAQEAIEKNKKFVIGLFGSIAKKNKTLKKGAEKMITLITEVEVVSNFFFLDNEVSNSEVSVSNNSGTTDRPNRNPTTNLGAALAAALINSANSSQKGDDDKAKKIAELQAQVAALQK